MSSVVVIAWVLRPPTLRKQEEDTSKHNNTHEEELERRVNGRRA